MREILKVMTYEWKFSGVVNAEEETLTVGRMGVYSMNTNWSCARFFLTTNKMMTRHVK